MPASLRVERPDRYRGSLLGGAVGDVLGFPVVGWSRARILSYFGDRGITQFAPARGGIGLLGGNTQLALFTAEGLLRARVRAKLKGNTHAPGVVAHAYLRWLLTQDEKPPRTLAFDDEYPCLFAEFPQLEARRTPGKTTVGALKAMRALGDPARNSSKSSSAVPRGGPVGLYAVTADLPGPDTYQLAADLARLTHGHPTAAAAAGAYAVMIRDLAEGASAVTAIDTGRRAAAVAGESDEVIQAIDHAVLLRKLDIPPDEAISRLGRGIAADDAIAISAYCALVATDFSHGIALAVNHDGRTDVTGALVGGLLGARYGAGAILDCWLDPLELRDLISQVADDLANFGTWEISDLADRATQRIWARYPGF